MIQRQLRYGALFAGYGGLEIGAQSVLGGELAWYSEYEPPSAKNPRPSQAAARIMAYHHPGVPNLGDITQIDWRAVPPVDVLTGGSPCQDVSTSGKRVGMRAGTRSGLWASMCEAIEILRPQLVVWENVQGVLSSEADSAMEPCPGCVGDGDDGPVLRALGRVLGDLAGLGYDAWWCGLRAADVGAPHARYRVFVFAAPADTEDVGHERGRGTWPGRTGPENGGEAPADADGDGLVRLGRVDTGERDPDGRDREDPSRDDGEPTAREEEMTHAWAQGRPGEELRDVRDSPFSQEVRQWEARGPQCVPEEDALLSDVREHESRTSIKGRIPLEGKATPWDIMIPLWSDGGASRSPCRPEPHEQRSEQRSDPVRLVPSPPPLVGGQAEAHAGSCKVNGNGCSQWGIYAQAVHRWEIRLGRLAPPPTEVGPKGARRLSALAVEWLMGLPAGHVTGVPGISRNDQLKALGNGVVPEQAAAATRRWLNHYANA